jgi:putative membrane protein
MLQQIRSNIPGRDKSSFHEMLIGIISGLVATGPMTGVMLLLFYTVLPGRHKYRLPPSQITNRLINRFKIGRRKAPSTNQRKVLTWLAHFGYGGGTGSLYPLTAGRLPVPPVISGMLFGMGVWLVSYMGWLPAADILPPATRLPRDRNILMILSHLAWGSVIGILTSKMEDKHDFASG